MNKIVKLIEQATADLKADNDAYCIADALRQEAMRAPIPGRSDRR